ncbi:response regulator transcription factor [Paenibacillus monticola]|uniref:Response regulator n=1 Tax=Paenibacillus monticola TaxID=2666075 RepID=A0A7X2H1K7_9BACL|nr:response regulator [Paenibacillus monticola]MRN51703.1 response regulator [Paenibacillus monticola]
MKFRVLLIDDEPSALEGMQMWIDWQELGFEVCGTSSNGKEGLQLIQQLTPDLVITDVNMPLMNGLEMIAAWQQTKAKDVKFAILSGYSEFEYAQTAIRYGINHYLLKPIIPEEAAEELKEIYQELEQESEALNLNQMASSVEIATLIKGVLYEKSTDEANLNILTRLSENRSQWGISLIQTQPELYGEVRGSTAALLANELSMYLIDLDANILAIVYGYTLGHDQINAVLNKLLADYVKHPLAIAVGASVSSLLNIANAYQSARETMLHYFYRPEFSEILSYQDIQNDSFSYHYDQMKLMDAMIKPLNTLDRTSFIQAVGAAASSFREMLIAPEVVKKIVIHIMYKIIEYTREAGGAQVEYLLARFSIPEILDSLITLNDLMDNLLACGEESINLLLREQSRRSQGIVQDINHYIQENFRQNLTIKRLAEIFYLHPVYLGQLLMKKNGMNFNVQLHSLRIEEAMRLFRQNTLKNSEIADKVGYSNYGQFLKQFEKKMQMSPNEYKQTKI